MSRIRTHPRSTRFHPCLLLVAALASTLTAGEQVETDSRSLNTTESSATEFFNTRIQPILVRRCYGCHSHEAGQAKGGLVLDSRAGWQTGGASGPAIHPGKPDESLLVDAIRHDNLEMPPNQKLPASEIKLLEQWVAMGAPDPREPVTRTIDRDQLWALEPIEMPAPPQVADQDWPVDELDRFLLVRLEELGIQPAPETDRYTLLRRVTFDLTGLPPTPQDIDAFLNDSSPDAYQRVVDRLLDSEAFGDHWARHWFDLACYADLADITGNVLIRDAWRYRDYVISAFNNDKPLNRFIHEQLAGDLLPFNSIEQRREQLIATGFLAIGPWTLQNYIKGQLDADVVDHQIDRIGRTFLGQTISCARCHDHKFDPIPTRDYYALAGIFHSTRTTAYDGPGVWSQITHVTLPSPPTDPAQLAQRNQALIRLKQDQQALQAELTSLALQIPGATDANVLTLETGIAANQDQTAYEISFEAGPSVWAGASQSTTDRDGLQIEILRTDGSVLAAFRHNPGGWTGTPEAQQLQPVSFAWTGDGSGDVRIRLASSTPGNGRFGGALDRLVIRTGDQTIFEESFDRLIPGSIEGQQAHTRLRVLAGTRIPGWVGSGINHSHAVDLGRGNYAVQFFGGTNLTLSSTTPATPAEKQAHARATELERQIQDTRNSITALEQQDAPETALAVHDIETPADGPVYRRGDFQAPGEIVPRGFLNAVHDSDAYQIPTGQSGRLQLAGWLTDSQNPLTARVLVNRVWHHVFGQGLVRTVDYFGVHGEQPSHPRLLDFLAHRLQHTDHWSLKATVRRMVLSRAYRMASTYNAQAAQLDPDNRLLWRMRRRRLTAESIRDAMLAASGELNPARGGPSLGLELEGNIRGAGGDVNPPTWGEKVADSIRNRRTIYLPLKRERPVGELEILSTFDFPHPSEITGARPETTVATQALFLMNAPFVKQQASTLAQRLFRDEPLDERARVNRLYLLTIGRPADANELQESLTFLDECEPLFDSPDNHDDTRRLAWTQLCHALLASNQFLFRE